MPANLSGGWLLAGQLPASALTGGNNTSLTATFDVIGQAVTGVVSLGLPCFFSSTSVSTLQASVVTGTVAADGSFTLTSPAAAVGTLSTSLTLQGKVPSLSGGTWSGTYSLTSTLGTCNGVGGTISATPIAPISGVYTGTVGISNQNSSLVQATTVQATLQQGGYPPTATGGTGTVFSNAVLSATLALPNAACLKSGKISSGTLSGGVEGATFVAFLTMNDGSSVEMVGAITSQDASKLSAVLLTTSTGTCAQSFVGFAPIVLSR